MSAPKARRRAAFLDRDGVINIDHGYTYRQEDFRFVPGALAACAQLHRWGLALVVVTNQSGIGRGLYAETDYQRLTDWMKAQFASAAAPLAGAYHCPHLPDATVQAYRRRCDCRKPAPGLLLQAASELELDLTRSALFGDKVTDIEAALAAGVPHRILLGTDGKALPDADVALAATARFTSLAAAVASRSLSATLHDSAHA